MRENRPYGSEGGGDTLPDPYPVERQCRWYETISHNLDAGIRMVPGDSDHSIKPMARRKSAGFKLRASAASALAAVAMTVALPAASTAPAQEGERSFGLFDQIFGGSARLSEIGRA